MIVSPFLTQLLIREALRDVEAPSTRCCFVLYVPSTALLSYPWLARAFIFNSQGGNKFKVVDWVESVEWELLVIGLMLPSQKKNIRRFGLAFKFQINTHTSDYSKFALINYIFFRMTSSESAYVVKRRDTLSVQIVYRCTRSTSLVLPPRMAPLEWVLVGKGVPRRKGVKSKYVPQYNRPFCFYGKVGYEQAG